MLSAREEEKKEGWTRNKESPTKKKGVHLDEDISTHTLPLKNHARTTWYLQLLIIVQGCQVMQRLGHIRVIRTKNSLAHLKRTLEK